MGSNPTQGIKSFSSNENVIQKVVRPWSKYRCVKKFSVCLHLWLRVCFILRHLMLYWMFLSFKFHRCLLSSVAFLDCIHSMDWGNLQGLILFLGIRVFKVTINNKNMTEASALVCLLIAAGLYGLQNGLVFSVL